MGSKGYVRPPLRLVFEGEEFDGLNVWSRRVSLNKLFELQELAEALGSAGDGEDKAPTVMKEQLMALFERLVPCLIAWNLQEADNPLDDDSPRTDVPLTVEGLSSQDPALALAIVDGLVEASSGVPAPLEQPSPNGEPSRGVDALTDLSSVSQQP